MYPTTSPEERLHFHLTLPGMRIRIFFRNVTEGLMLQMLVGYILLPQASLAKKFLHPFI
jgi:hypothetical protein